MWCELLRKFAGVFRCNRAKIRFSHFSASFTVSYIYKITLIVIRVCRNHGVRHGQKSGRANTEYIVYKNYNSL